MKDSNGTSFILVAGIFIVCVFVSVAILNILPDNNESNSYYVKVEDEMSATIEALNFDNNKLVITTSGDALEYCAKSTKSRPSSDALCWKKIENNEASISIYEYKKYYVWIKDINGNISNSMSFNTNEVDE